MKRVSYEEFAVIYSIGLDYKRQSYNNCLLLCNARTMKPCIIFCADYTKVEVYKNEIVLQRYRHTPSLEGLWIDYQCSTMALIESGDVGIDNINNVSRETNRR